MMALRSKPRLSIMRARAAVLGLRGDWQTTGRLRYGFFIETAFTANPSNRVSMAQPNGILDVTERHADLFFER